MQHGVSKTPAQQAALALAALAAASGVPVAAVEERIAPLVAAGRLAVEEHHGVRMVRVKTA